MPGNSSARAVLLMAYLIAFSTLAYAVVDVYNHYQEIGILKAKMADSSPTSNTVNIKKKSTYDMQRISSLQLFGAEKKEARPKTVDAPVTRLKLTLIGIIAANDSGVSKAIIQIDNKQTMVFSVGDKLSTGNAEIYEIQPDKVLLKRKGRLESLVLDRPDLDRRNDRQRGAQKGRLTYGVEEKLMTIPNQVKPSVQPEVRPPR